MFCISHFSSTNVSVTNSIGITRQCRPELKDETHIRIYQNFTIYFLKNLFGIKQKTKPNQTTLLSQLYEEHYNTHTVDYKWKKIQLHNENTGRNACFQVKWKVNMPQTKNQYSDKSEDTPR